MTPNLLLLHQHELGITDAELVVLLNLELHRHKSNSQVWPSAQQLAGRSGKDIRTIRTNLYRLRDKGLIKVAHRIGLTNVYDLRPLIGRLEGLTKTPTPIGRFTIPPRVNSPSKEESTEKELEDSTLSYEWKEITRLNLKNGSKTKGYLRSASDLRRYKETGLWPGADT